MEQKSDVEERIEPVDNTMSSSFFFQLNRLRKVIFKKTTRLMIEADIQLQLEQLPLLVILNRHANLSQRELSDITLRDKSSILRSIDALEKKGLLLVEQDKGDKRKKNVSLSAEGQTLALKVRFLMKKAEEDAFSVFSKTEHHLAIETIRSYADKMESAEI